MFNIYLNLSENRNVFTHYFSAFMNQKGQKQRETQVILFIHLLGHACLSIVPKSQTRLNLNQ